MEIARELHDHAYNDLAATVAEALGFQAGQGLFVVRHLTAADEIGGQVDAEGTAKILLALAGNLDLSAPQKTVSRFWDLPITQFLVGDFTPFGEQTASVPLDDIFVSMFLKHLGYSFGEFLANTIRTYSVLDQTTVQPMSLNLGGGPGKTWAKFTFLIAGEPERLTLSRANPNVSPFLYSARRRTAAFRTMRLLQGSNVMYRSHVKSSRSYACF